VRTLLLRPEILLVAFIGLVLRFWILLTPSGVLLADEAVTGLSALDVSQAHFGILIPESYYTALTESYLFSPFIQFFGAHVVPLKLMGVVLWFAASLAGAALGARLGGTRSAVTAFSLLWLVPGAIMVVSTRAYLGYPGGVLVVLCSLLALVRIVQEGLTRRRVVIAGFLIGLAFMMHPIYIGALAPAALVVTWRHRRAGREWYLPLAVGFVVGCGPWLWWNLRHHFASLTERDTDNSTYVGRVKGYFSGILPRDLGLKEPNGTWTPNRPVGLLLVLVFLAGLVWAILRLWRSGTAGRVLAVPAVASWFALGVFAHTSFVDDGRYGIMPFPICVVVLAVAIGRIGAAGPATAADRDADVVTRPVALARRAWVPVAVVAAWLLVLVLPYQVRVIGTKLGDPNEFTTSVARALDAHGITNLTGDYFDVLQVSYLTEGRIATKVFYPLPVRYPRLEQRVSSATPDQVAVLFSVGAERPEELKLPVEQYDKIDLPGHTLYVPKSGGS